MVFGPHIWASIMLKIVLVGHLTYENQWGKLYTNLRLFFGTPWSVIRSLLTVFRPDMERLRLVEANDRSLEMRMIINQVLGRFCAFLSDQGSIIVLSET